MEKKKVVPVWVSVILVILLVAGIVLNVCYTATYSDIKFWEIPTDILYATSCVLALVYCIKGYSKNAAIYFSIFCIVYCISSMITVFGVAGGYKSGNISYIFLMALHLIIFACLSILTVAKDLGKKKSLTLAWIILICTLINFIYGIFIVPILFILSMCGNVILSIVFVIMIYAKYMDKAARGAK